MSRDRALAEIPDERCDCHWAEEATWVFRASGLVVCLGCGYAFKAQVFVYPEGYNGPAGSPALRRN